MSLLLRNSILNDDFLSDFLGAPSWRYASPASRLSYNPFVPSNDIALHSVDQESGLRTMKLNVPGYNKDNLNIEINGNTVIVENKDKTIRLQESLPVLSDAIDHDSFKASIADGVLTVTYDLSKSKKPKTLKLTAG